MLSRITFLLCLLLAPVMAKDAAATARGLTGQIYSHGTLRMAGHAVEAVVEVAAELIPNIHMGQQVWMDVRQGRLQGTVKDVHSPVEVTIALDASRSKVKLSRLQHGQAVIAVIQLEPDCDCEGPEWQ